MLCFSQPAFIGQHFSATLAVRQALSEQAGGSLCWQLPVSCFPWCFGSFSSLCLFPQEPRGAPAELLRLQQGCSSHKHAITFLSAGRETEQMLRAGSCPGHGDTGAQAESGLCWHHLTPAQVIFMSPTVCSTVSASHKDRPGWWDEAQEQTAVLFSPGKLQGYHRNKSAQQGKICKVPLTPLLSLSASPVRNSDFRC